MYLIGSLSFSRLGTLLAYLSYHWFPSIFAFPSFLVPLPPFASSLLRYDMVRYEFGIHQSIIIKCIKPTTILWCELSFESCKQITRLRRRGGIINKLEV